MLKITCSARAKYVLRAGDASAYLCGTHRRVMLRALGVPKRQWSKADVSAERDGFRVEVAQIVG